MWEGIAEGTVRLDMLLPDQSTKKCQYQIVLFVPNLSYNLLSVSKISSAGKMTRFHNTGCEILNKENNCF